MGLSLSRRTGKEEMIEYINDECEDLKGLEGFLKAQGYEGATIRESFKAWFEDTGVDEKKFAAFLHISGVSVGNLPSLAEVVEERDIIIYETKRAWVKDMQKGDCRDFEVLECKSGKLYYSCTE